MQNNFQIKVPPSHTFEGNKEREKSKSGTSYLVLLIVRSQADLLI